MIEFVGIKDQWVFFRKEGQPCKVPVNEVLTFFENNKDQISEDDQLSIELSFGE